VRPNTKTFFLESPTNPTLDVLDIKAIADIVHERRHPRGRQCFFDAALSASARTRRRLRGLFATKHIDGKAGCLGGVILGSEKFIQDNIHN